MKFTILILRFLQLFCEGHNLKMQNMLRVQPHVFLANKHVNFIEIGAKFLRSFVKFNNVSCIDLGEQILDFLLETVQGPCQEN
jgi:hypothetical protein